MQSATGYNSFPHSSALAEEVIAIAEIQAIITSVGATNAALYDLTDSSTLYQNELTTTPVVAAGDLIGRAEDLSGFGNSLIQATVTARPLWSINGGVLDGVDDFLRTDTVSKRFTLNLGENQYIANSATIDSIPATTAPVRFVDIGSSPFSGIKALAATDPALDDSYSAGINSSSVSPNPSTAKKITQIEVGKLFAFEMLVSQSQGLNIAVEDGVWTTASFTGAPIISNAYMTMGMQPRQFTQRRFIWMQLPAGNFLTSIQRSTIREWLKQRKL